MSEEASQGDILAVTVATWVYTLHVGGAEADHEAVRAACAAVDAASGDADGDAAGEALVAQVADVLSGSDVAGAARSLYGDRADSSIGEGDRGERVHRIRKYQFTRNLPWLAQIVERQEDGTVGPTWLVVEQVTDRVVAMDPNPWNDIDEERQIALHDFQVLWELTACASVAVR